MKKRIGLLVCDTTREDRAAFIGQYIDRFTNFLESQLDRIELIEYKIQEGHWPSSPEECDGYIVSGSRHSANDGEIEPWIAELIRFIRECYAGKVKMVGICFGHQVIAKAMGGQVELNPNGWGLGIKQQEVLVERPWMEPFSKAVNIVASHKEHVFELPGNAELLLTSPHCRVAAYEIKDLFLGFQGHPETTAYVSSFGVEDKMELLGSDGYREAKCSLTKVLDQRLIANWIGNFFYQK